MKDNNRSYPLNHAEDKDQENKTFCPVCGAEVPEGSRFCNKCGADLSGQEFVAVYAGPEYFQRKMSARPMETIYAGPEYFGKNVGTEEPMNDVYGGPEMMEGVYAGPAPIEALYAAPRPKNIFGAIKDKVKK